MLPFRSRQFFIFFLGVYTVFCSTASAQYVLTASSPLSQPVNGHGYYFTDESGQLSAKEVARSKMTEAGTKTNFGFSSAAIWLHIPIRNESRRTAYFLKIDNPLIDTIALYQSSDKTTFTAVPNAGRHHNSTNPLFRLNLPPGSSSDIYIRIKSDKPLITAAYLSTESQALNDIMLNHTFFSIFLGITIVMFFYNLFIFITTRDRNYLFYIIYIIFLCNTQICLHGYHLLFSNDTGGYFVHKAIPLSTSLVGISSLLFIKDFLNLGSFIPWANRVLTLFIGIFLVAICLSLLGYLIPAQLIIQANTFLSIVIALYSGIRIQIKGFKPALFFNVSWSFFLVSVIIFIMKDAGVLPANLLTQNSILIGAAIETTLLSFALADKINILRKEKEESQTQALIAFAENERIIKEQNIILEERVNERTLQLKASNDELNETLEELKQAQSQLVESEKMASLGQLTAGIAHEINNPINFVASNVSPLQRDILILDDALVRVEQIALSGLTGEEKARQIEDIKAEIEYDYLKMEIQHLIKGIQEGSQRTAEIVKGLRVFSRLDEDDRKKVNIHEGLDATLTIINTLLGGNIEVSREYGSIPQVECYPGKLNQVFLNILTNAIHAVNARWHQKPGGRITIRTYLKERGVLIDIADNGIGMKEETAKHIFEPFFTTKDVGEGTGLGLSIVYNIIKKHNGIISVSSAPGEGTVFTIELPSGNN